MVHGVVETPRTNLGDATYLGGHDFDITQEASFQSPSKDNVNILQQMGGGRRGGTSLKTPRSRMPFGDRRNAPAGYGGAEFTPLLKSATRNAAMYGRGKENKGVPQTPAFLKPGGLDNISEHELTPVANMNDTMYEEDSDGNSYVNGTPIPRIDSSSIADSPMNPQLRRNGGPDGLSDGNHLSLKEQENVIDKIEKENFGLKLKIHFLEEALRKAGPGFSEAALKENTELKVDKVTMQKELHRYRKTVTATEREVESYKQQVADLQDKVKHSRSDGRAQEELDHLRRALDDKEAEVKELYQKLDEGDRQHGEIDKLRDAVTDLEHDLREKDRQVDERDDQIENLRQQVSERDDEVVELEQSLKAAKKRETELNKDQWEEEINEAKDTISELQEDIKQLKQELREAKEEQEEAVAAKERAEADLEELQDELANKSIAPKGLNRQIEEKANRLQTELDQMKEKYEALKNDRDEMEETAVQLQDDLEETRKELFAVEVDRDQKLEAIQRLQQRITDLDQSGGARVNKLRTDLEDALKAKDDLEQQNRHLNNQLDQMLRDLQNKNDEKDLLQARHDALTHESQSLQSELARKKEEVEDIRHELNHEKTVSLQSEREVREEYKPEIDRLHDELEDLRADIREKQRLYDDDCDKWDKEKRNLEAQRRAAEDQVSSLKRTIEKLQAVEGSLSGREAKLQEQLNIEKEKNEKAEAALNKQISELKSDVDSRQRNLEEVKNELAAVREELRLTQREQKVLLDQVTAMEDEIDVLQSGADEEQERLQSSLRASDQKLSSLEAELKLYKSELEKASSGPSKSLLSRQVSSIKDIQDRLDAATASERKLSEQVRDMDREIQRLQRQHAETEQDRDALRDQLQEIHSTSLRPGSSSSDAERVELRTSKARLEIEVRRLRDETALLASEKACLENELVVERENAKDDRLLLKERDLDLLKCDAAAKETIRDLKRQIEGLERQAHQLEISLLQTSSPGSSGTSARSGELVEVRNQLANAHANIKELRARVKESEKEAKKKITALNHELARKAEEWDTERFNLERDLDSALAERGELETKNAAAESAIARLKAKIARLEAEVQTKRGDDSARADLDALLAGTEAEKAAAEEDVKRRDEIISRLTKAESELRAQLQRVRDEREDKAQLARDAIDELEVLDAEFRDEQQRWEEEKAGLTRGVRFPNTSLSEVREGEVESVRRELEEREKRHVKELRGLAMQIEWLRARVRREEGLRADAAYAKRFVLLQVELYGACNQADLSLLHQMGIHPSPDTYLTPRAPISLKRLGLMVLATVRMKRGADAWAKSRKVRDKIQGRFGEMRRAGQIPVGSTPKRLTAPPPSREVVRSGGGGSAKKSLNEALMAVAGSSRRVNELRGSRYR